LYVDIDLCNAEDRAIIRKDVLSRGGELIYPAIIIDDEILINNLQTDKLREVLGI
jgi:disulfide oxidoreductase YuzD